MARFYKKSPSHIIIFPVRSFHSKRGANDQKHRSTDGETVQVECYHCFSLTSKHCSDDHDWIISTVCVFGIVPTLV